MPYRTLADDIWLIGGRKKRHIGSTIRDRIELKRGVCSRRVFNGDVRISLQTALIRFIPGHRFGSGKIPVRTIGKCDLVQAVGIIAVVPMPPIGADPTDIAV